MSVAVFATDALSVLAEASRYLFQSLLLVRDANLSAPTPCQDWDLRRLLDHVRTSLEDVADVLVGGSHPSLAAGLDPIAALRAGIVDVLLASTSLPIAGRWCEIWGRYLPATIVVYVAAVEMALHAWDIAQACSVERPVPADLASALLRVSPPLAQTAVVGHLFGQPLPVATTATASDRLLARFGRQSVPSAPRFQQ
jgi:uncharacterized protein (TIGR03086 family)